MPQIGRSVGPKLKGNLSLHIRGICNNRATDANSLAYDYAVLKLGHLPMSEQKAKKILVVDDNEQVRKIICDLLGREKGWEVICEAAGGQEGVLVAEKLQPDVVVLDISMPTLGGLDAAVRISWTAPKSRIVFLSQHNSKALVDAALATGAHGYVTKSNAGTELTRVIRAVLEGEKFVSQL